MYNILSKLIICTHWELHFLILNIVHNSRFCASVNWLPSCRPIAYYFDKNLNMNYLKKEILQNTYRTRGRLYYVGKFVPCS